MVYEKGQGRYLFETEIHSDPFFLTHRQQDCGGARTARQTPGF